MQQDLPPLILTLKLDAASFAILDTLRQSHFPAERNFLSAHITLFHALPGSEQAAIRAILDVVSADTARVPLEFSGVRLLGRGVAVDVRSDPLLRLRKELAQRFGPFRLSPQDSQGYRPHVTIQNKVPPSEALALHENLVHTWVPFSGSGEGLLLWEYLGGPWRKVAEFAFAENRTEQCNKEFSAGDRV